MERESEVRSIAYQIWEEKGFPNGTEYEDWLKLKKFGGAERTTRIKEQYDVT
jgi:hypothetical protein